MTEEKLLADSCTTSLSCGNSESASRPTLFIKIHSTQIPTMLLKQTCSNECNNNNNVMKCHKMQAFWFRQIDLHIIRSSLFHNRQSSQKWSQPHYLVCKCCICMCSIISKAPMPILQTWKTLYTIRADIAKNATFSSVINNLWAHLQHALWTLRWNETWLKPYLSLTT